ncbi:MAG: 6-bladed beta-propeller [Balneolaceae bacterium]|nr:6-bladed beta-propeller [Balneolaceae bacterium]
MKINQKLVPFVLLLLIVSCSGLDDDSYETVQFDQIAEQVNTIRLEVDALGATIRYREHLNGFLILDGSANKIYLFSDSGTLLHEVGGPGQGPGEFTSITSITSDEEGRIFAYDGPMWRLSIFDHSGNYTRSFQMNEAFRMHDMVYANGLLYTFSGFTHDELPFHISAINPENGMIVNQFMETSDIVKELGIPISGALQHINLFDDKIIVTHPLELSTYFFDLEGSLLTIHQGNSSIYKEPDPDSYTIPAPLYTALPALIASSRPAQAKYFIEFMELNPEDSRGNFLEIFDKDGNKLSADPISIGFKELMHVNQYGDLLFLERATEDQEPRINIYSIN